MGIRHSNHHRDGSSSGAMKLKPQLGNKGICHAEMEQKLSRLRTEHYISWTWWQTPADSAFGEAEGGSDLHIILSYKSSCRPRIHDTPSLNSNKTEEWEKWGLWKRDTEELWTQKMIVLEALDPKALDSFSIQIRDCHQDEESKYKNFHGHIEVYFFLKTYISVSLCAYLHLCACRRQKQGRIPWSWSYKLLWELGSNSGPLVSKHSTPEPPSPPHPGVYSEAAGTEGHSEFSHRSDLVLYPDSPSACWQSGVCFYNLFSLL